MKVKHGKHKMLCAVLFLSMFMSSSLMAFAAEAQTEVTLPVQQVFEIENTSTQSVDLSGSYRLSTTQAQAPMPQGASDKVYDFSITGKTKTYELLFTYTKAGVYSYRLQQLSTDKEGYTYDRNVYDITVYVKNGDNGDLISEIIVENADKEKCESLLFKNTYKGKNQSNVNTSDSTKMLLWELLMMGTTGMLLYGLYRIKTKINE